MSTKKKFYLAKYNQEGGTIENDFKEFSKYLMELIGATTDEELQNFVKEQGPEKVNEIYKQWKKQVPMAKDGMQFANNWASKAQEALMADVIAIRNKIQDTAPDDLRGISSFKKAFAEATRRGLRQFSWGKGIYTTELAKPSSGGGGDSGDKGDKGGVNTNREVPEYLKRRDTSVQAGVIPKYWDTERTGFVPSKGESNVAKPAAKPAGNKGGSTPTAATTPTPLQPVDPLRALGLVVGTAGAVTAVGAGTIYGADKYYKNKAAKRRAARASASSAPKPSIFRNLGDNAKEYLSKVPFKEKVNEYTSKAASLFKRTSAPVPPAAIELVAPPAAPAAAPTAAVTPPPPPPAALRAKAKAGTGAAAHSAPARTLRVKARAGEMARTVTAPSVTPPSAPAGSTFKWGGWEYDATPKFEGTTPKPEVKPEVKPEAKPEGTTIKPKAKTAPKPKATAPKSGGKSGKALKPKGTTTLAGKMAGRANMLGMALGLISDLFASKEERDRSDAIWRIQKRFGSGYPISEEEIREEINPTIFKEGGKVNKLDYINRLNGECPEGYTAVKFAKGGVICTTCQKNKEVAAKKKNHLDSIKEEMKCGGKMKSHQKGGEMTNAQYKKAPLSKKVDQDLMDQAAGKNAGEGGTPKTDLAKSAPKKLIKKPTKK